MFKLLLWKMAWLHLRKQGKMTLLSILGGCIGAMLITSSVIFVGSFEYSGQHWIQSHLGPIDWEATPVNKDVFSAEEAVKVRQFLQGMPQMQSAAIIQLTTPVLYKDGNREVKKSIPHAVVLGIKTDEMLKFNPALQEIWNTSLQEGEALISTAVANQLQVRQGDVITIFDSKNVEKEVKVRRVVEEAGVTGYRGAAQAGGTILISYSQAASLKGVLPTDVSHFFISGQGELTGYVFPQVPPKDLFRVEEPKGMAMESVAKMKKQYGSMLTIGSIIAILSGILLMYQLILMLGESRKGTYGTLRAIGYNKSQIRRIFLIEASLLNSISIGVGIVLGSLLGYGLIAYFESRFGPILERLEGGSIPILAHYSVRSIAITAAALFIGLTCLTLWISYRVGKFNIVASLRGEIESNRYHVKPVWVRLLGSAAAISIVAVHLYHQFSGEGSRLLSLASSPTGSAFNALAVIGLWIAGLAALLFLFIAYLPYIEKFAYPIFNKLGLSEEALLLATRYPRVNFKSTYLIALLFSLVFTVITLTLMYFSLMNNMQANNNDLKIMGYAGQVFYKDEPEKKRIQNVLNNDHALQPIVRSTHEIEPYILTLGMNQVRLDLALAALPSSEAFAGKLSLVNKSPKFANDKDVWNAVKNNRKYIVLNEQWSIPSGRWPENHQSHNSQKPYFSIGDKIKFTVYTNATIKQDQKVYDEFEAEVIGFAKEHQNSDIHTYNFILMNPELYHKYASQGTKWMDQIYKGSILLDFDPYQPDHVSKLQERLLANGIKTLDIPNERNLAQNAIFKQTLLIFEAYLILAVCIGIIGLMIIQFRAVQDRFEQIAMLRSVGISRKSIMQIFLTEGSMIGILGLICGILAGTSGGYIFVDFINKQASPLDNLVPFQYPLLLIISLLLGVMILTIVLNLIPAKRAISLTPGEAIRARD